MWAESRGGSIFNNMAAIKILHSGGYTLESTVKTTTREYILIPMEMGSKVI